MMQFRILILHSIFCTRVPKEKKKNKVKEKKLNNSLYSRNKSVLFALVYSCDFSHAKIKQFLRLISHHHTIQCLVGLLFINHKVFSYLLVHFCLSLLFKSWVQWHSCIELFFCLNWKIIALQCCVCFCHKTTRISHKYIPTLLSLPPTAPIPPL